MKHPSQYWSEFKAKFDAGIGRRPLTKEEERHMRLAFHSGILATHKAILALREDEPTLTKDEFADQLMAFQRHNMATLLQAAVFDLPPETRN